MINVTGLCRKYGDYTAVDDVSFSIGQGEVIGLLGHNGAGKTTIMKMLTGFLEPNAGTINIDGLDIAGQRTEVQQKIGYLPENCPVYPEMTVLDYLDYAAELHGLKDDAKLSAVRAAINKTELADKARDTIITLSRGYRQRVGVAQAILPSPQILILDEPTNGLDPTQIEHMRGLIRQLSQTATIIVSTHILQEVQAVCERVLIMRQGRLVVDAKLGDLQNSRTITLVSDCQEQQLQTFNGKFGIAGISAKPLQNNRVEYTLMLDSSGPAQQSDIMPSLISELCAQNIAVYAIYPQQQDLESVFREVNAIPQLEQGVQAHAT